MLSMRQKTLQVALVMLPFWLDCIVSTPCLSTIMCSVKICTVTFVAGIMICHAYLPPRDTVIRSSEGIDCYAGAVSSCHAEEKSHSRMQIPKAT